jgi:Flp pilus assembly protein TadD
MLTHIDANGNDSPAILVDDMTAANRAVNIPEFVNIAPDGMQHINPEATEFYRLFNQAYNLMEKGEPAEAIAVFHQVLEKDPNDPIAHYALATVLTQNNQERDAVEEYRKACAFNTNPPAAWYDHFAVSLANTGDLQQAATAWRKALTIDPSDAGAESDLGAVLYETGQPQEGEQHLRRAIELAPNFAEAHNRLGWELAKENRLEEAVEQLQEAVQLSPGSVDYLTNLGYVRGISGDVPGALANFQKAVQLSGGKDLRALDMLATAYYKSGHPSEAVNIAQQAINLAIQQHDQQLEQHLRGNLERFEHDSGPPAGR